MTSTGAGGAIAKRFSVIASSIALWGAALFSAAGQTRWERGWICLAVYVACLAVTGTLAFIKNPDVIVARSRMHRDAKGFDKLFSALYTVLSFAIPIVAGLDAVRFGWSSMSFATIYPGIALFVLGTVPITWAMLVNRFLETQVRIQTDRGHRVVTDGPYRFVRHPMYSGILLQTLAVPLILGSWWTFVPVAVIVAAFFWRTALEDRTLQAELPGYAEYAAQTRYRILPGVW